SLRCPCGREFSLYTRRCTKRQFQRRRCVRLGLQCSEHSAESRLLWRPHRSTCRACARACTTLCMHRHSCPRCRPFQRAARQCMR
ncbi:hypothetical protein NERG_00577, partial [Nematocida ausubeli]